MHNYLIFIFILYKYTFYIIFLGILSIIKSTRFVVYLFILEDILQKINILSLKLQQESVTLGNAANLIESIIDTFENSRSIESWNIMWEQIKDFLKTNNVSIYNLSDAEINGNVLLYITLLLIEYS